MEDLSEIRDVDVSLDGNIYVVGGAPARLVRVAPNGTRSRIAGPVASAEKSAPGFGPSFANGISEAAVDLDGTVLVLSEWRVWRVRSRAEPGLVAGSFDPLAEVGNGDGGPAEHALFNDPLGLTATTAGYFVCDNIGRDVRMIDRTGTINHVSSFHLSSRCAPASLVCPARRTSSCLAMTAR